MSPYDALSHQYWREGLDEQLAGHQVVTVTLAPRYFSWRFRGNSLTLSHDISLREEYDLVIATSMADLSALKGMCPPLQNVPAILYFHENQFAYPDTGASAHLLERQITSLYSAIAADRLVFNSNFNKDTFLSGVDDLLARMPDGVPPEIVASLDNKSLVIAVALRPQTASPAQTSPVFSMVWNHRWEQDKGVVRLEMLVRKLLNTSIEFQFHLIGQKFRKIPVEIRRTLAMLRSENKLGEEGFVEDRDSYIALLNSSHLVLSTAQQEFQGLAVLEAMQAGCIPVVPDGLSYREFVPAEYRYQDDGIAVDMILDVYRQFVGGELPEPKLPDQVDYSRVKDSWQSLLAQI